MRRKIWKYFRSKYHHAQVLPTHMMVLYAILFPLDFFYWKYSKAVGYDMTTDRWTIAETEFSDTFFYHIKDIKPTKDSPILCKIYFEDDILIFETLKDSK